MRRKLVALLTLVGLLVSLGTHPAQAQSIPTLRYGTSATVLSAVSAATPCSAANGNIWQVMGESAYNLTWEVDITGGPPASIQIDLKGAMVPTGPFYQLDTYTTVADTMRHVVNKSTQVLCIELVSIGAGGGTVTAQMTARSMGR